MHTITLQTSAWYGDYSLSLEFPDHWEVREIGAQPLPTMGVEEIRNRLLAPIASPQLSELAVGRNHAAILVDDLSRPTPASEILPLVFTELFKAGLEPEKITIVIASGTHAPASAESIQKKIGTGLPHGIQVVPHNAFEDLKYVGRSRAGTPLYFNPLVLACDLRISIGCIYPHPAAGFSGGAKALVPGVAGSVTIRHLHDHFRGSNQRGGNLDNEFRTEVEQIASQIGLDFVINATLNQRRRVSNLFAGDTRQAFRRGVDYVRKAYTVETQFEADIIIADMYPFDADLQFAADRGMWPIEMAQKAASKIILCACPGGLGTHTLFPLKNSFWPRLTRRLKYFNRRDFTSIPYRLGAAYRLLTRRALPISIVSSGLNQEQMKSAFPSGALFQDWQSARMSLESKFRGQRVRVNLFRCAPLMLPLLLR